MSEENKVMAAITSHVGIIDTIEIMQLTKLDHDRVKAICRKLTDDLQLWEYFYAVKGKDLRGFPQTFKEYLDRCKGENADWYHNQALSRAQVEKILHYEWSSDEKEWLLEYENALLRIDLNQAISKPNDVKARRFATVFTESFGLAKVYGDQNKEDKTQKVYQLAQDILSSWSKNDVQKTMSLMRRKGDNQVAAASRMLVKMAEAYIQLYEKMKNPRSGNS